MKNSLSSARPQVKLVGLPQRTGLGSRVRAGGEPQVRAPASFPDGAAQGPVCAGKVLSSSEAGGQTQQF